MVGDEGLSGIRWDDGGGTAVRRVRFNRCETHRPPRINCGKLDLVNHYEGLDVLKTHILH